MKIYVVYEETCVGPIWNSLHHFDASDHYSCKTKRERIFYISLKNLELWILKHTIEGNKTHISSFFYYKVFIIENNQWKFEQN